jgi:hypothetical protein
VSRAATDSADGTLTVMSSTDNTSATDNLDAMGNLLTLHLDRLAAAGENWHQLVGVDARTADIEPHWILGAAIRDDIITWDRDTWNRPFFGASFTDATQHVIEFTIARLLERPTHRRRHLHRRNRLPRRLRRPHHRRATSPTVDTRPQPADRRELAHLHRRQPQRTSPRHPDTRTRMAEHLNTCCGIGEDREL